MGKNLKETLTQDVDLSKAKDVLTQDVDLGKAKNASKKTMSEFKEFAMKGNVIDMAVGVIIGNAFGKIVTSFVNDMIMPAISILTGKIDFNNLFIVLNKEAVSPEVLETIKTLDAAKEAGLSTLNWGVFLTTIVDFLIIAFSIFIVTKKLLKAKKVEEAPAPAPVTTKECPYCKSTIAIGATRCPHCTSELSE